MRSSISESVLMQSISRRGVCSARLRAVAVVVLCLAAVGVAGWAVPANADSLYWSGAGTWDDGNTPKWGIASNGPYDANWIGGYDARFEGTAGAVTVSGTINSVGAIYFDANDYTLAGGTIKLTGAGGNITTIAGNNTINSVIGGAVGLTKNGTGTLTLGGVNIYTGATTVKAGTLALGAAGTIANSTTITVGDAGSTGAVLDLTAKAGFNILSGQTLKGIGTVNIGVGKTVTVDANGHWAPGNSIGTNAVTGNLTLSGISDFELGTADANHVTPGISDRTDVSGTLTLGGTLNLIDNAGANGQGSAGAGSYLIFTQTGTAGGSFAPITNIAGYHAKVDTATSGKVFLDNYQIAAANAITTPVNLGNVHVGGAFGTSALTITNTASTVLSEGLDANQGTATGDASVSGTNISNLAGGSSSTDISVGLGAANMATSGLKTGTVAIDLASNGASSGYSNTTLTSQVITVNGGVYDYAAANAIANPTNLFLHQNSTGSALNITNTAPAGAYTEGLDAAKGAVTGNVTLGGTNVTNLAGGSSSGTILLVMPTATLGSAGTGTATIDFVSNGTISGLANTPLTSQTFTVNGTVYSGLSTWIGASGGSWGTIAGTGGGAFGLNWDANQGSPGLDPAFTGVDTATFGSTSGSVTVNLDGAAPNLNAVTFNGTGSYTIAKGTGATGLTLAGTTPAITATGAQVISTPVVLAAGTTVAVTNTPDTLAISGPISDGGGSLTKTGAGTLTLSGTNSFNGQLSVQNGTLAIGTINNASAVGPLGSSALAVSLGNTGAQTGTLQYTGATATSTKKFTMATGGTGAFQVDTLATNLTLSGVIDGSGAMNKTGAGALTPTGANTYTGGTTLTSGTLNINTVGVAATSGPLGNGAFTINGGTIDNTSGSAKVLLNVNPITVGGNFAFSTSAGTANNSLTLPGDVDLGSSTRTITTNGAGVLTLSGIISNASAGLTKAGTGTLTLTGANTYTGATTVSGGRLQLDGNSAAGTLTTSGLAVGTGGTLGFTAGDASTLDLTGKSFSLGGTVAFDIGATVSDAMTVGAFTLTAPSAFTFSPLGGGFTNGATYTLLTSTNDITTGGFTITGQVAGRLSLTPTINAKTVTVTPVLVEGVWNQTGSGLWGTVGNWTGYKPTVAGDAALFGSAINGPATITVDSAHSVGYMRFDNATKAYTIGTGSSNLTLDNSASAASVVVNSGSHIIAENVLLASNATVAPAYGATLTVSGNLSGGRGVSLTDAGTLALSGGANSYTGATSINAGILSLTGSLTGGTAITTSGTGILDESAAGVISGASSFTQGSSGTSILAGDNTYTGPTTITAGTLQLDGNTAAGSTVAVGTAGTLTGSGTVKGNATITGAGIIDLASTGQIAGTLGVTGGNWNGQGSVGGKTTATSGVFTIASDANMNVGVTVATEGVSFEVTGSGRVNVEGTLNADPNTRVNVIQQGTMVVTGTVNTSGRWVTVGSGNSAGVATLILEDSGQWNHTNLTVNAPFVIGEAGACRGELIIRDDATLNAPFMRVASWGSTTWGVITQDGGTVTLAPTTAEYLSVAEPAIGLGGWGQAEYHLNGGVLNCGLWNGPAIWAFWYGPTMGQGRLYFNGGTLIPNTDDPNSAVGGLLNGQGSYMQNLTQVIVQAGGAIIDTDGHKITIAQNLEHDPAGGAPAIDGGLTKLGLGTLTLNGPGANTYTGPTTVSGGRLQLNGSAAAGTLTTSGLAVGTGATLGFTAGTASTLDLTGKPFSLGGTVALDIGASGVNDALTVGNFTLTGNSALTFNIIGAITNGATYTLLTSANPIVPGIFGITGQAGKFALTPTINANTVTLTCVLDEGVWNQTGGGLWGTGGNWTGYKPAVAGDAARFGSAIAGPAVIAVDTPHTVGYMRFDDANAYTIGSGASSNLTLDSGGASSALVVVTSGSHIIAENVALASSVAVAPASGATLTVSGSLSGAGGVSVCDAGTLVLSGVNTYTGDTAVTAGTLEIGGSGQLGGGTYDGAIAINTGATFRYNSDANQTLQTGVISGGGNLIKDGAGTLTLSAANTHTGPITVANGVLNVEHAAFTVAPRTYNINSGAVLNVVSDWYDNVPVGTTTFNGAGTLRFTGGLWIDWYSGDNRFITMSLASGGLIDVPTGDTMYNGGWWAINWTSNLADLNVDGTFNLWDGKDVFVDALTGSGTVTRGHSKVPGDPPVSTLTVGVDNGSGTFSGNITHVSMPLEIVKTGSGTQTLTGANTYTGATIVNAGTLALSGTGDINSTSGITVNGPTAAFMHNSSVAISRTFTLTKGTLGGNGTISTAITSGANVIIAPGDRTLVDPEAGILYITNAVNLTGGTTEMRLFSATESDMLVQSTAGALTYGGILKITDCDPLAFAIGNNWDLFDFTSQSGTFSNDSEFGTVGGTYLPLLTSDKNWSFAYTTGILSIAWGLLPGDTNGDRVVDAVDYIALKTNLGMTEGATLAQGNFDADIDGNVDWDDLQILMANFGKTIGGAPATPEPATLGLLAIGALAVLRLRRRK